MQDALQVLERPRHAVRALPTAARAQLLNPHSLETLETLNLNAFGSDGVVTCIRFRQDVAGGSMQNVMLLAQVR